MPSQKGGILAAKQNMGLTDHFTTAEVAEQVGVSLDTIRRWRIAGYVRTKQVVFGKTTVYLFDAPGVQRCKELKLSMHAGRPKAGDTSPKVSHPRSKLRAQRIDANISRKEILKRRKRINADPKPSDPKKDASSTGASASPKIRKRPRPR